MTTISVNPGDNVQQAANALKAGDELRFRAGTHYGRVSIPVDGVVVAGEPGAILDGTQAIAGTWSLATDSDDYCSLARTGTWRIPLAAQPWVVMDSPSSMIFRIDSDFVGIKETIGYYHMTAYQALAVPEGGRSYYDADWWNGIEAMWVYNLANQHLYVRYRDGKKPANLRWSGGHSDHRDPPYAEGSVIWLAGRRDVIVRNLEIRGCVDGIAIMDSTNVSVEKWRFRGIRFCCRRIRQFLEDPHS
jgi:hypothetical protein